MRILLLLLAGMGMLAQPGLSLMASAGGAMDDCCASGESCCISDAPAEPEGMGCCSIEEELPKWAATCSCGGHETPAVGASTGITLRSSGESSCQPEPPRPGNFESDLPGRAPNSVRPDPEEPPPRG